MSSAYMIRLEFGDLYSIDVDKKEEGTENGSLRDPTRSRERWRGATIENYNVFSMI